MNGGIFSAKQILSFYYRSIDYVLVAGWFTCEALINAVISQGVRLIGMYKIASTKFLYRGHMLTYSEINRRISKPLRCRSLKYHYKRADMTYGDTQLTLYFARQGKKGNRKVFLTTDKSLSFISVSIWTLRIKGRPIPFDECRKSTNDDWQAIVGIVCGNNIGCCWNIEYGRWWIAWKSFNSPCCRTSSE